MSETLTLAQELEATEAVVTTQEEETWGTELMNFVSSNQNVVVRCPWMGGEVTLGEAMLTYAYPPNMTENDLPTVTAVVHELLANRILDEEELEEEDGKSGEDETSEKEDAKKLPQEPTKTETKSPKPDQKAVAEKIGPQPKSADAPAKAETKADKPQGLDLPGIVTAAEKPAVPFAARAGAGARIEAAAGSATTLAPEESDLKKAADGPPETFKPKTAKAETVKAETPADIMTPLPPEKPQPEASFSQSDEAHEFSAGTETINSLEPAEIETPSIFPAAILENLDDFSEDETDGQELETVMLEYQERQVSLAELSEDEEILIRHSDETVLQAYGELDGSFAAAEAEEAAVIQLKEDISLGSQAESDVLERPAAIDMDTEVIEECLIRITEKIKTVEPGRAEDAGKTLDKISELAAKLERQGEGELMDEAEAQEELEVLFTELFDRLGIDYTPQLIQSLSRLTVQRHLAGQNEILKTEESDDLLWDEGTHEIIKKLLAAAASVKKAMKNAYVLGKSAIQLYTYDFPTELRRRLAAK